MVYVLPLLSYITMTPRERHGISNHRQLKWLLNSPSITHWILRSALLALCKGESSLSRGVSRRRPAIRKPFPCHGVFVSAVLQTHTGIILCKRPANERRRHTATSFLIGWVLAPNYPCSWLALWITAWYGPIKYCHYTKPHMQSNILLGIVAWRLSLSAYVTSQQHWKTSVGFRWHFLWNYL